MAKIVMVVDDESDVRNTVKQILEHAGYNVITATNGDECLQKLLKERVDLILLDIMMPGTPVKEVINRIKKVKIAFLTVVRHSEEEKAELIKTGYVVDFIEKPFDIDELLSRVKKIIGPA